MEKGFILPDGGYVQAIDTEAKYDAEGTLVRPEITAADYPTGTIEVSLRPSCDHHWENGEWQYMEPAYTPRVISRSQFEFLLAYTGFGEVWDAMAEQARAEGDLAMYASLVAERQRTTFHLDAVLAAASSLSAFAALVAPTVDLSEAAIRAAWVQAEDYWGIV